MKPSGRNLFLLCFWKKNRMKLLSAIYKNFLQQNLINAQGYSTLVCPLVSTMSCRLFSKQNSSFLHWKQRCIHYYYHIIIIKMSHSGTFKLNDHTVTWCIPIEKLYLVHQNWRLHLLLRRSTVCRTWLREHRRLLHEKGPQENRGHCSQGPPLFPCQAGAAAGLLQCLKNMTNHQYTVCIRDEVVGDIEDQGFNRQGLRSQEQPARSIT